MSRASWCLVALLPVLLSAAPAVASPAHHHGSRHAADSKKHHVPDSREHHVRQHLEQVKQQIAAVEGRTALTQEQRAQKEKELQDVEVEIGRLKRETHEIAPKVDALTQHLTELQQQRRQLTQEHERQAKLLARDVRMEWRLGQNDYFKLLLNQQHPEKMSRLIRDYSYLKRQRSELLLAIRNNTEKLAATEQAEQQELERYQQMGSQLQSRQKSLQVAQTQRGRVVAELTAQLQSQQEQLARLSRSQGDLQQLLEQLQRLASVAPPPQKKPVSLENKPLPPTVEPVKAVMKGRCGMPAAGGLRNAFGSARLGGLRWNGVLIAAAPGSSVRAIRAGKVVYADYVRGFGLLTIVDHGRGLMSLYGQNQSLLKAVGEQVSANDVIALAGASGNAGESGVYFEVRERGQPRNPLDWCAL